MCSVKPRVSAAAAAGNHFSPYMYSQIPPVHSQKLWVPLPNTERCVAKVWCPDDETGKPDCLHTEWLVYVCMGVMANHDNRGEWITIIREDLCLCRSHLPDCRSSSSSCVCPHESELPFLRRGMLMQTSWLPSSRVSSSGGGWALHSPPFR